MSSFEKNLQFSGTADVKIQTFKPYVKAFGFQRIISVGDPCISTPKISNAVVWLNLCVAFLAINFFISLTYLFMFNFTNRWGYQWYKRARFRSTLGIRPDRLHPKQSTGPVWPTFKHVSKPGKGRQQHDHDVPWPHYTVRGWRHVRSGVGQTRAGTNTDLKRKLQSLNSRSPHGATFLSHNLLTNLQKSFQSIRNTRNFRPAECVEWPCTSLILAKSPTLLQTVCKNGSPKLVTSFHRM